MTITATKPTLSPNYTKYRPIGAISSNAINTIVRSELSWIIGQWESYEGFGEDRNYNIIYELRTPTTNTRIWICDRDGPESQPIIILPEDY